MGKLAEYLGRPPEWFYHGDPQEPLADAIIEKLDEVLGLIREAAALAEHRVPMGDGVPTRQSDIELLIGLGEMRERNLLSDEEFTSAKARLLGG
jgi:hypothetical protein